MTPEDLAANREMVRDLNELLARAARRRRPGRRREFLAKHGAVLPGRPDARRHHRAARRSGWPRCSRCMRSMTPEQRAELQSMMDALLRDDRLRWDLAQLAANLDQLLPGGLGRPGTVRGRRAARARGRAGAARPAPGAGPAGGRSSADVESPGDLAAIDRGRGPRPARRRRGARPRRARRPRAPARGGRLPRPRRRPARADAARQRGGSARRCSTTCSRGCSATRSAATGSIAAAGAGSATRRPSRTSSATRSTSTCAGTLFNALAARRTRRRARGRGDRRIRLAPSDFEVYRTEELTRSSTVLLVDMSRSMLLRGCFLAAKKVAVALDTLIRTQYPRDHLSVVGFAYYAREIRPGALAELTWHGYEYGTNLQHGLMLARRILARDAGGQQGDRGHHRRRADRPLRGRPGRVQLPADAAHDPARRCARCSRCTREGITINTFMLERSRALAEFVALMTQHQPRPGLLRDAGAPRRVRPRRLRQPADEAGLVSDARPRAARHATCASGGVPTADDGGRPWRHSSSQMLLFLHVIGAILAFGPTFAYLDHGGDGRPRSHSTRTSARGSQPLIGNQPRLSAGDLPGHHRRADHPGLRSYRARVHAMARDRHRAVPDRHRLRAHGPAQRPARVIEMTSTPPPPGHPAWPASAGAHGRGQEGPARRHAARHADRDHRLPDGGQADVLTRVRYHVRTPRPQETRPMPHVATSPTDLLAALAGIAHLDGDRLVIDDEAAFRDAGIRDLAWTAAFSDRRGDDRRRPLAGLGGEPGARRPLGQHPGAVRGPRPRRGVRLHGAGASTSATQTFDMARTVFEAAEAVRRRRGHPRARTQRADLHLPAADRLRDVGPRRRDRRRLAGPGLRPGRPLPVQRQEVRGRPGGDDRGDPARLPARGRCRLPQHRHRLLDAGRPVEADGRRAAARELRPRRRADGAHPVARERRRDGQRRRRDRRGRATELDGGGAARRTSTATAASSTARAPGAAGISKVSVQTGTSHGGVPLPDGGVAEVKLDFEVLRELGDVARAARPGRRRPARRVDAARRAVPPLPGGRDRRDPPRDRVPERALRAPGVPGRAPHGEIEAWVLRERADERKDGQTDQQFVYTTRKKAIGPFKRELWDLSTKDEILAAARRKVSFLFQELRVTGTPGTGRSVHPPGRAPSAAARGLRGAVAPVR